MKTFPILYHKGKSGEIRTWSTWADGDTVYTEYGVKNGKLITASKQVTAKNVGKKSETTLNVQAEKEAESLWKFKKDRKYSETEEGAEEELQLPMLAKDLTIKKLEFPILMQPKLDGCFTYHASVTTDQGCLPIGRIVEEKLNVKVLSYNETTKVFEFKNILNWFNNGKASKQDWLDLEINKTRRLRCTKTHKFLTNNGWRSAEFIASEDLILSNQKSFRLIGALLGTLMGDSCISFDKRGKAIGARLRFTHSNFEYLENKVKFLNIPGKLVDHISGYGSLEKTFVSSVLDIPELNLFYFIDKNEINFGKRLPITQNLLSNYLTKEGLALWICDDGSLRFNNGNLETPILSISTHNLNEDEIEEVCAYFENVWGVSPSKIQDKRLNKPSWSITFNSSNTVYLLSRLRGCALKGMEYKFFFKSENYPQNIENVVEELPLKITRCKNTPPTTKYDIEVEDNHNYVVNGVVAHNCRAMASWDGDRVKLISRAGIEWTVPTHIVKQVAQVLPKDSQFDGELYIHGKSCQTITSYVKRLQPETWSVEYHIYDMPVVDGDDTLTNEERYQALSNVMESCEETHLVLVETIEVHNEKEVWSNERRWVELGNEGGIGRNKKGKYRFGYRSWDLQKVKTFKDAEFLVVDCNEGIGSNVGCAIFVCQNDLTDAVFNVTCSCPIPEKKEQFTNKDKYIGQYLTVKFFDRTDAGIPRFPIGAVFRSKEDLPQHLKTKGDIDDIISKATIKPKLKMKTKSLFDSILEN
jgi:hypothetical protein